MLWVNTKKWKRVDSPHFTTKKEWWSLVANTRMGPMAVRNWRLACSTAVVFSVRQNFKGRKRSVFVDRIIQSNPFSCWLEWLAITGLPPNCVPIQITPLPSLWQCIASLDCKYFEDSLQATHISNNSLTVCAHSFCFCLISIHLGTKAVLAQLEMRNSQRKGKDC